MGTHQAEVNLIPRAVISAASPPSYLRTVLLFLSDDEVSESETPRRPSLELTPPLPGEPAAYLLIIASLR